MRLFFFSFLTPDRAKTGIWCRHIVTDWRKLHIKRKFFVPDKFHGFEISKKGACLEM